MKVSEWVEENRIDGVKVKHFRKPVNNTDIAAFTKGVQLGLRGVTKLTKELLEEEEGCQKI